LAEIFGDSFSENNPPSVSETDGDHVIPSNIADIIFQTIKLVFTSAVEEYRSMPRLMTTCTLYIEDKEL